MKEKHNITAYSDYTLSFCVSPNQQMDRRLQFLHIYSSCNACFAEALLDAIGFVTGVIIQPDHPFGMNGFHCR